MDHALTAVGGDLVESIFSYLDVKDCGYAGTCVNKQWHEVAKR